MSLTLYRNPSFTLATDRAVIKRDEVAATADAVALLRRIDDLREAVARECEHLRAHAQAEGHALGLDHGREEAMAVLQARLVGLEQAVVQERDARRAQAAALALAVFDRVVGELGPQVVLPALVARALEDVDVEGSVSVRVHPEVAEAVSRRLAAAPRAIAVVADASLARDGCEVEARGGRLDASLATQREALGAAFAAVQAPTQAATRNPVPARQADGHAPAG
jgi:flagellar biosynthesis/type III secretory pathway protein FliH